MIGIRGLRPAKTGQQAGSAKFAFLCLVPLAALFLFAQPVPAGATAPVVTKMRSVSLGNFHTCGIRAPSQAGCWGYNQYGQLGDSSPVDNGVPPGTEVNHMSPVPVLVSGLNDAESIEAGGSHSCAVRASGEPLCWGFNYNGQLGDNTLINRSKPGPVNGLPVVRSISVGGRHTCAIRPGGQAVCWGQNLFGELGNNSRIDSPVPVNVSGLTDAVEISAGGAHTCAIRTSGQTVCWGRNSNGQLGNNTKTDSLVPVSVLTLDDAESISSGSFSTSCAIRRSGQAVCWGSNGSGGIGDGTTQERLTPMPVFGLVDAKAISTGNGSACAIRRSGQAVCWGANSDGGLGDGTTEQRLTPVNVLGLPDAAVIDTLGGKTCAIRVSGKLYCWGTNFYGNVGDGTAIHRSTPTRVLRGAFDGETVDLTVEVRASGGGLVRSEPRGIECGGFSTCTGWFDEEAEVTLTATPDRDTFFAGWSGACSGTGPCVITLESPARVTANFERKDNAILVVYRTGAAGARSPRTLPGSIAAANASVNSMTDRR